MSPQPKKTSQNKKASDEMILRLTNLSFALQNAANTSRSGITSAWIRKNVDGYGHYEKTEQGNDSFNTALKRDIKNLQRAGLPIVITPGEDKTLTYSMSPEHYLLPEVEFTSEEAQVLGIAAHTGKSGGLSDYRAAGWTKIAASGVSRGFENADLVFTESDLDDLDPAVLRGLNALYRHGERLSFTYQQRPTVAPSRRLMDVWGVVPFDKRNYLVGWDIEREDVRVFRVARILSVSRTKKQAVHKAPAMPLEDIVRDVVTGIVKANAVASIPEGTAHELADAAQRRDDGLYEFTGVNREWLIRTAASYSPGVEVIEPQDIREEIIALLRQASEEN